MNSADKDSTGASFSFFHPFVAENACTVYFSSFFFPTACTQWFFSSIVGSFIKTHGSSVSLQDAYELLLYAFVQSFNIETYLFIPSPSFTDNL